MQALSPSKRSVEVFAQVENNIYIDQVSQPCSSDHKAGRAGSRPDFTDQRFNITDLSCEELTSLVAHEERFYRVASTFSDFSVEKYRSASFQELESY